MRRINRIFFLVLMAAIYPWLTSTAWACPCYDIPVTPLYQNDYTDRIDNSNQTIASQGCTLTAWTMALDYSMTTVGLHNRNPDGTQGTVISYTPADINRLLNDYRYEEKTYKKDATGNYVRVNGKLVIEKVEIKNGWGLTIGPGGNPMGSTMEINMGALFKAVEKDTKARSFEGKGLKQDSYRAPGFSRIPEDIGADGVVIGENYLRILEELEQGRPVVVRVANDTHSVLVTSFQNEPGKPRGVGRYDIRDPSKKADGSSIRWLDDPAYTNRIFNWDTGVFKAGGLHDPFSVPSDYYIDPLLLTDTEANPDYFGQQVFLANHVPEPNTVMLFGIGLVGYLLNILAARRLTQRSSRLLLRRGG